MTLTTKSHKCDGLHDELEGDITEKQVTDYKRVLKFLQNLKKIYKRVLKFLQNLKKIRQERLADNPDAGDSELIKMPMRIFRNRRTFQTIEMSLQCNHVVG